MGSRELTPADWKVGLRYLYDPVAQRSPCHSSDVNVR